jgi:hypothetical protein
VVTHISNGSCFSRTAEPDISRGVQRRISHTAQAVYLARRSAPYIEREQSERISCGAAAIHAAQRQFMQRSCNSRAKRNSLGYMMFH